MKKSLWTVVWIVALLAVSAIPAMAGGDNNMYRWDGMPFSLIGQVTALDAEAKTITVAVINGSGLVKSYSVDGQVLITTNSSTTFALFGPFNGDEQEFGCVELGDYVNISGYVDVVDSAVFFIADRVVVDFPV